MAVLDEWHSRVHALYACHDALVDELGGAFPQKWPSSIREGIEMEASPVWGVGVAP